MAGEPGADGLTMHQALLLGGLSLIGQHLISTPRNLHGAIKRTTQAVGPIHTMHICDPGSCLHRCEGAQR